jgi:hypothetical protein
MQLDIRYPMGLLFSILGLLIAGYGLFTKHLTLGININLWWGLVLLAFGAIMLLLARAGHKKTPPAN